MYKKITDENTKNSEKSIIKKAIVQKLWVMERYVRNTINLSCAKILLTSVICLTLNLHVRLISLTGSVVFKIICRPDP